MRLSLKGILIACLLALSISAMAAPSTDGWIMDVANDGASVNLFVMVDNMGDLINYDGEVSKVWENVDLGGGARLKNLELGVDGDPVVKLNFDVYAGSSLTNFTITSAIVSFPTIVGKGTATAAVTVTDNDGNGAAANGLYDDGKFYQARYNGSTLFASLVSGPVAADPYSSEIARQTVPPWVAMGSVSSIQSQFSFNLTAEDGASGTSSFTVIPVPEPGSIICLITGVLGLVGVARRRA